MPLLIQTQRWHNRKPEGPQQINRGHPLARGLGAYFYPCDDVQILNDLAGDYRDVWVRNTYSSVNMGFPSHRDIPEGRSLYFDPSGSGRSNDQMIVDDRLTDFADADEASIFMGVIPRGNWNAKNNQNERMFFGGRGATTGGDRCYIAHTTTTNSSGAGRYVVGADVNFQLDTPYFLTIDKIEILGVTFKGANSTSWTFKAYANGVLQASFARTHANDIGKTGLGGIPSNVSQGFTAHFDMLWAAFWSRQLTEEEIAWLHAEPYALLRPRRRRLFYVVDGGGRSGTAVLSGAGIITVVARKSALAIAGIAGQSALTILASRGARAAGMLGATGTLSVLARASRMTALTVSGIGTTATTGTSARLATVLVSTGGTLAVSGTTSPGAAIDGRIPLAGIHLPTLALAAASEARVALQGKMAPGLPLAGRLP